MFEFNWRKFENMEIVWGLFEKILLLFANEKVASSDRY